jgi:hypothetical protein
VPLRGDEVLTAALAAVPLETSGAAVAAAALGVHTEVHLEEATVEAEALAEATGKLKQ